MWFDIFSSLIRLTTDRFHVAFNKAIGLQFKRLSTLFFHVRTQSQLAIKFVTWTCLRIPATILTVTFALTFSFTQIFTNTWVSNIIWGYVWPFTAEEWCLVWAFLVNVILPKQILHSYRLLATEVVEMIAERVGSTQGFSWLTKNNLLVEALLDVIQLVTGDVNTEVFVLKIVVHLEPIVKNLTNLLFDILNVSLLT